MWGLAEGDQGRRSQRSAAPLAQIKFPFGSIFLPFSFLLFPSISFFFRPL
jgi:hypothetical protein